MGSVSWREQREILRARRAARGWHRPPRRPDAPLPDLVSKEDLYAKSRPINDQCGIYFLWLGKELVYVGQSKGGIYGRLGSHLADGKKFDRISFVSCSPEDLNALETAYIRAHRPSLNLAVRRRRNLEDIPCDATEGAEAS